MPGRRWWPGLSQKECLKRELVFSALSHIRLMHDYEFFLTVGPDIESDGDIDMRQGGLYAVLRFKNLDNIGNAWEHLRDWIRENKYEYIEMQKGDNGWRNRFEERLIGRKGCLRMNGCLIYGCN